MPCAFYKIAIHPDVNRTSWTVWKYGKYSNLALILQVGISQFVTLCLVDKSFDTNDVRVWRCHDFDR